MTRLSVRVNRGRFFAVSTGVDSECRLANAATSERNCCGVAVVGSFFGADSTGRGCQLHRPQAAVTKRLGVEMESALTIK